jgi:hypothetical protein
MKSPAVLSPPVIALVATVVIVALGLVAVAWYWFLTHR